MATLEQPLLGRLTINEAEEWRNELIGWLEGCEQLVLDARELTAVDVAGLQLLVALRRSAARAGKRVRLAGPPQGILLAALIRAGFRREEDSAPPASSQDGFWWGIA